MIERNGTEIVWIRCLLCGIMMFLLYLSIQEPLGKFSVSRRHFNHQLHQLHGLDHPDGEETKQVRVLCWIMTTPKNHQSKAAHVKATWGQRCDKLLFMSTESDPVLQSVGLEVADDYNSLWGKTKAAFTYVHTHHFNDADWFLKADDDTYVVVENLRYMLQDKNTSEPIYFGHKFKPFTPQGYFSGGAGYVLSKEALRRFVEVALHKNDSFCKTSSDGGSEDVELGNCMWNAGVTAGDSRDIFAQKRFFPFTPESVLIGPYPEWYFSYRYYTEDAGFERLSDLAISFHYVSANMMYLLEYLIYHLHPFDGSRRVTNQTRMDAQAQAPPPNFKKDS